MKPSLTKMQVWSTHRAADVAHTLIDCGIFADLEGKPDSINFEVVKIDKDYYEFSVAVEDGEILAEIVKQIKHDSQWS